MLCESRGHELPQGGDRERVVPGAVTALQFGERHFGGERAAVRAIRGHCFEDIRDGEDPRRDGQLLTGETERVAAPVQLLVMCRRVVAPGGGTARPCSRNSRLYVGCCSTRRRSSGVSCPGLSRIRFEMPSLPMSCSRPAWRSRRRLSLERPSTAPIAIGDLGDTLRVAGGERRLGVDHAGERSCHAVDSVVVDELNELRRLELEHKLRHVVLGEPGPEAGVVLERAERTDQLRVEPASAPVARRAVCGFRALARREDVDGLREADDAAEEWDRLAHEAVRTAAAVPVLVERL